MRSPSDLVLATGRAISLESLDQWRVYAGLLEGVPREKLNERLIDDVIARVRRKERREPFVIRPVQRPLGPVEREPHGLGARATLPSVGCVGRFVSSRPARDPSMATSVLTVIWFQDDFAFPLDDAIAAALHALDWDALATDRSD